MSALHHIPKFTIFGPTFTPPNCPILQDPAESYGILDCNQGIELIQLINWMFRKCAPVQSETPHLFSSSPKYIHPIWLNDNGSIKVAELRRAYTENIPNDFFDENGFVNLSKIHVISKESIDQWKKNKTQCPLCMKAVERVIFSQPLDNGANIDQLVSICEEDKIIQIKEVHQHIEDPLGTFLIDCQELHWLFLIDIAWFRMMDQNGFCFSEDYLLSKNDGIIAHFLQSSDREETENALRYMINNEVETSLLLTSLMHICSPVDLEFLRINFMRLLTTLNDSNVGDGAYLQSSLQTFQQNPVYVNARRIFWSDAHNRQRVISPVTPPIRPNFFRRICGNKLVRAIVFLTGVTLLVHFFKYLFHSINPIIMNPEAP